MSKEKQPQVKLVKTAKGLSPTTAYDFEMLEKMAIGQEFDLIPDKRRSSKHTRTYWLALHRVVQATGRWPTAEHLHDELKLACGFYRTCVNLNTSQTMLVVDSIAFNKMSQQEFKVYMDSAMQKLSEAIGFDPLRFLEG